MKNRILKLSFFKKHPNLKSVVEVLLHTYIEWSKDGTLRIGAGIAYYGIIAIVPLLFVTIGIAELFFSSADIIAFIESFVVSLFGDQASEIIPEVERELNSETTSEFKNMGLIGLGGLLFSATVIFIALQDALRVIWKLDKSATFLIKRYLLSFAVMLFIGTATTMILLAHSMIAYTRNLLPEDIEIFSFFTGLASIVAVFAVLVLSIMVLLKSFITVKIAFKDLIVSSMTISALLYAGVYALSIYFSTFADKSVYGAVAGLILVLLAIYYFSQIFLAGAQLTKVISYRNGNPHLQPHLKKTDPRD